MFGQFKVVGYAPSWAGSASAIQYSKLTHINYAFILPTSSGGLTAVDNPTKLRDIVTRAHAANVKVLIAVGGWNDGNDSAFEAMARSSTARTTFVNNLVNLCNQYNLDGVDIDWEYPDPGTSGSNYALMMQQLGSAMHSRGKLLTAAVIASGSTGGGVPNSVFGVVDFLNLMAYDGGGSNHSTYEYAVSSVNYWVGRGLPASKAVIGLPFYGRSSSSYVAYNTLLSQGASPNSDSFNGVGYNGIPTIKRKTNMAFDRSLGGVMMWELSQDATGANSLLTAIDQVVDARSGGGGTVAAPTFSPGGGTYSSAQSVSISTTTSGATIRYTINGSNPTSTTGTVYTGPISIGATSTVRAIAYLSGMSNSSVSTATYTINTGGGSAKLPIAGSAVTASSNDGNVPANTVDGNLATRWSASGDGQWIRFDLGAAKTVSLVKIAFYNGNVRTTTFDLQTSADGNTWSNVLTNQVSSGTSTALQTFDFTDRPSVRYVRIVGHGNSVNAWNSLTEVEVWGF